MRGRLSRLVAHPLVAGTIARTGVLLRRGFMPFRASHPLDSRERWLVVWVWSALGGIFGCAWLALLAALVPSLRHGSGWILIAVLLLGSVCFFAGVGYLMTGIGNRLVGHTRRPRKL